MKKIKNAVTKHRIFTSINVTHINSRKKEVAHAGYGRSLPSAFSHGVSVPDVTDAPAGGRSDVFMKTRISVQERLKDLRVERGLNLEELAQETFCQTVRKPGIPPDGAAQQCSGCGNYRDDSKRKTKYY